MGKAEQSRSATQQPPRRWNIRWLRKAMLAAPVVAALLGSGCHLRQWVHQGFKVGPNYAKPPAPVAPAWIDYQDPRVQSQEKDLSAWWHVFNDPTLDHLIETAYQQNLSLRVAGARILEARAERNIAVGSLFPQLQEAAGSYTRNKASEKLFGPTPDPWYSVWQAGFNLSWELDFWGLYRRAVEQADARLDASVESYDDVLVVLLADVASAYVQYRTFEERLTYARENVAIQERSYELAKNKFEAGATTERDVQQARQVLEQTRALIPALELGQRTANNQLCILLGIPPVELGKVLTGPPRIPATPREVALGIPADLLRRRPDVRRIEREAAAQSAAIGIAEAEFYPHISLTGSLGIAAQKFSDLWDTPESMTGSFGPSFRWNILNYGRILNNVRAQDARFQQLVYAYQQQVLQAGQEAETALASFLKTQEVATRLRDSVRAAERTVEITYDQYREGAVDFTPLFLFQSTLAEQQDVYAATRGDIALSLIAVYRALGGGWEMRLTRPAPGCGPSAPPAPAVAAPAVAAPAPAGPAVAPPAEAAPAPDQPAPPEAEPPPPPRVLPPPEGVQG